MFPTNVFTSAHNSLNCNAGDCPMRAQHDNRLCRCSHRIYYVGINRCSGASCTFARFTPICRREESRIHISYHHQNTHVGRTVPSQTLAHAERREAVQVCHAYGTHMSEPYLVVTDSPRPYIRAVSLYHTLGPYRIISSDSLREASHPPLEDSNAYQ